MEEEHYYEEYEIDLREYILLLWKNKWFIIGLFILAVVAAFFVSQYYLSPVYESKAVIQITNIREYVEEKADRNKLPANEYNDPQLAVQYIQSDKFISSVLEKTKDLDQAQFSEEKIEVDREEPLSVHISVKDDDPETSRLVGEAIVNLYKKEADDYYEQYQAYQKEYLSGITTSFQEIDDSITLIKEQIEQTGNLRINDPERGILINGQLRQLYNLHKEKNMLLSDNNSQQNLLLSLHPTRVLASPSVLQNPVSPNTRLNVAIAGVLALMLGVFIVFFREFMKDIDWEEVEEDMKS